MWIKEINQLSVMNVVQQRRWFFITISHFSSWPNDEQEVSSMTILLEVPICLKSSDVEAQCF